MKEGRGHATFLRGFEDIVGDVEFVVIENCEDAEVKVRDVERGRGDEDFCGGGVFEGSKRGRMVRGIRQELHTL